MISNIFYAILQVTKCFHIYYHIKFLQCLCGVRSSMPIDSSLHAGLWSRNLTAWAHIARKVSIAGTQIKTKYFFLKIVYFSHYSKYNSILQGKPTI